MFYVLIDSIKIRVNTKFKDLSQDTYTQKLNQVWQSSYTTAI